MCLRRYLFTSLIIIDFLYKLAKAIVVFLKYTNDVKLTKY